MNILKTHSQGINQFIMTDSSASNFCFLNNDISHTINA